MPSFARSAMGDIEVVTTLSHTILKHRLWLLAGHSWELHDVKPA